MVCIFLKLISYPLLLSQKYDREIALYHLKGILLNSSIRILQEKSVKTKTSFKLILFFLIATVLPFTYASDMNNDSRKVITISELYTLESPIDASPVEPEKVRRARSVIIRKTDEVCMKTTTKKLPEGAYTNWWLVFNNPENCSGNNALDDASCSFEDLENEASNPAIFRVASGIVGFTGRGIFDTCIAKGEDQPELMLGTGLENTNAEIQLIVKWHGPSFFDDSTLLGDQLTKLSGGCDYFLGSDYLGRNHCPDVQFAIHPAEE